MRAPHWALRICWRRGPGFLRTSNLRSQSTGKEKAGSLQGLQEHRRRIKGVTPEGGGKAACVSARFRKI
eukprot:967644-Pelagomonas_calceolata.AAC.3